MLLFIIRFILYCAIRYVISCYKVMLLFIIRFILYCAIRYVISCYKVICYTVL